MKNLIVETKEYIKYKDFPDSCIEKLKGSNQEEKVKINVMYDIDEIYIAPNYVRNDGDYWDNDYILDNFKIVCKSEVWPMEALILEKIDENKPAYYVIFYHDGLVEFYWTGF